MPSNKWAESNARVASWTRVLPHGLWILLFVRDGIEIKIQILCKSLDSVCTLPLTIRNPRGLFSSKRFPHFRSRSESSIKSEHPRYGKMKSACISIYNAFRRWDNLIRSIGNLQNKKIVKRFWRSRISGGKTGMDSRGTGISGDETINNAVKKICSIGFFAF
jgi:hypothetical protein